MNFFQIPAGDQSVYFLGRIFGYVGEVLPVSDAPLLLGNMFKTFNTVALSLGIIMVVYSTVVGLLSTAHEGEFMGKKWSGLWVPVRSLLGIVALFPTASGYSALQVFMMWIILQGVGAADMVWTTVLKYVNLTGSPFSAVQMPSSVGTKLSMETLYKGITCQAEAGKELAHGSLDPYYYCSGTRAQTDPFCIGARTNESQMLDIIHGPQASKEGESRVYKMGPEGRCGSLTFCGAADVSQGGRGCDVVQDRKAKLACYACSGQIAGLQAIVTQFHEIAKTFAKYDMEYLSFVKGGGKAPKWVQSGYCRIKNIPEEKCCISQNSSFLSGLESVLPETCLKAGDFPNAYTGDAGTGNISYANTSNYAVSYLYWPAVMKPYLASTNYISAATSYYNGAIIRELNKAISDAKTEDMEDTWRDAQNSGWILAGGYYHKLAQKKQNYMEMAIPTFSVPDNSEKLAQNELKELRNNYAAADQLNTLVTAQNAKPGNTVFSVGPPGLTKLGDSLNAAASDLMTNWMGSMTGMSYNNPESSNKNPLVELQSFGKNLLITGEVLFVVFTTIMVTILYFTNLSFFALGTGVFNAGGGQAFAMFFLFMMPIFFGFLGTLFVFGGMLAVYVPLIPYIVFSLGAIGWLIATIEAMVAAPLIGLGMLSPGGQHEILGRAEPAILMGLNVLLRPALMVFGLMTAMLLAGVVVRFVNATFMAVMGDISGGTPGLTEMILFMAAYTLLIVALLNKCFSLIHLIPERVLTWIGGHAVSYGEGEMLGEVRRGSEGAAQTTAAAGKAPMQETQRARAEYDKGKAQADEKANKSKLGG